MSELADDTPEARALAPLVKELQTGLSELALSRGQYPDFTEPTVRVRTLETSLQAAFGSVEQFNAKHAEYLRGRKLLDQTVSELSEYEADLNKRLKVATRAFEALDTLIASYSKKTGVDATEILELVDQGSKTSQDTAEELASLSRTASVIQIPSMSSIVRRIVPESWTAESTRVSWANAANAFLVEETEFTNAEVPEALKDESQIRKVEPELRTYSLFWISTFTYLERVKTLRAIALKRASWAKGQRTASAETLGVFDRAHSLYSAMRALLVESAKIPRSKWYQDQNTAAREDAEQFIADVIAFDYFLLVQAVGIPARFNTFGGKQSLGARYDNLVSARGTKEWVSDTFSGDIFESLRAAVIATQET